ncbi:MAG: AAA-type ATPase lid domain-containing protein, partial [Planctomycetota bacterium]
MTTMQRHPWRGNVRELKHVIERAVINAAGTSLRLADKLVRPADDANSDAANAN